jgi:hypothetical protein
MEDRARTASSRLNLEVRDQKTEGRRQTTEYSWQDAAGSWQQGKLRGQRSENRGQKANDRGQTTARQTVNLWNSQMVMNGVNDGLTISLFDQSTNRRFLRFLRLQRFKRFKQLAPRLGRGSLFPAI